jgi:hypothetical protein
MIDALGGEDAGPADDAVNLVPLFQQEFAQVRTVLPGDSGD